MVTSEARRAQMRAYYQDNRENMLAAAKEYYEANKEKVLAFQKEYREDNREERNARQKEYREDNREKISTAAKEYYEANREEINASVRAHYQANKEKIRVCKRAYSRANPGKINAKGAKRRAARIQRTPNWLTHEDYRAIRSLYETASALTQSTGIVHHVDHIIPLQGRTVSGFHCPNNLQILTQSENCSKNNKFTGDE